MAKKSKSATAKSNSKKAVKTAAEGGGTSSSLSLATLEEKLVNLLQKHASLSANLAVESPLKAEKQFLALGSASRIQQLVRKHPGPLSELAVTAILKELVSGERAIVKIERAAFLGPAHSYSHLATICRFGQSVELIPVGTIASVFEEVASGQVKWGVVPIENSTDGRIVDTLEMFTRSAVKICGEVPLPIHHNLLGIGSREEVREVCSKPQAISQCRDWLANHMPHAKLVPTSSTTAAAERAASNAKVAAIASKEAGNEYGLKVLAECIEDKKDNVTRFAIIGEEPAARTGNDKTSLMFELKHEPGALADAMVIFKRKGLNLTWIESFPKPNSPNEYLFFVEFVGYPTDVRVRRALTTLEKKTVRLEILGAYPQG